MTYKLQNANELFVNKNISTVLLFIIIFFHIYDKNFKTTLYCTDYINRMITIPESTTYTFYL